MRELTSENTEIAESIKPRPSVVQNTICKSCYMIADI